MFLLSLFLLLSEDAIAGSKYDHAIRTTATAVAKETGLESNYLKVRSATNKEVSKWAVKNGLQIPLTVVSFVAPVVYRKQVRIKSGDFLFKGTTGKVSLDWQFQF